MNDRATIAPVQKSVHVRAPIAHAFAVFTEGLTRWWPHTHGVGGKPIAKVLMEPRLGGRWLEIAEDGTETVVGTITTWEPPHRMIMLWQIDAQWKPERVFEPRMSETEREVLKTMWHQAVTRSRGWALS